MQHLTVYRSKWKRGLKKGLRKIIKAEITNNIAKKTR